MNEEGNCEAGDVDLPSSGQIGGNWRAVVWTESKGNAPGLSADSSSAPWIIKFLKCTIVRESQTSEGRQF